MDMTPQTKRRARRFLIVTAAIIAFYVITVGSIPAIGRHIEDGKLQWMRGSSVASKTMQIYEWPARHMAAFPPARALFGFSAACWMAITDAPETTG